MYNFLSNKKLGELYMYNTLSKLETYTSISSVYLDYLEDDSVLVQELNDLEEASVLVDKQLDEYLYVLDIYTNIEQYGLTKQNVALLDPKGLLRSYDILPSVESLGTTFIRNDAYYAALEGILDVVNEWKVTIVKVVSNFTAKVVSALQQLGKVISKYEFILTNLYNKLDSIKVINSIKMKTREIRSLDYKDYATFSRSIDTLCTDTLKTSIKPQEVLSEARDQIKNNVYLESKYKAIIKKQLTSYKDELLVLGYQLNDDGSITKTPVSVVNQLQKDSIHDLGWSKQNALVSIQDCKKHVQCMRDITKLADESKEVISKLGGIVATSQLTENNAVRFKQTINTAKDTASIFNNIIFGTINKIRFEMGLILTIGRGIISCSNIPTPNQSGPIPITPLSLPSIST